MTTPATIAYVGLGIMGGPAATHLLKAGHNLRIWARRPEATAALAELGATVCSSAAEAATGAEFAFTNVSDSADVEEVVLGANGYSSGLAAGSLVIDMSTISPVTARNIGSKLQEQNIGFLDTPVSGGQVGAENATLAFMCGGSAADFAKAKPLFDIMGSTAVLVGDVGAGQVAKCANQIIVGATANAIAESFALATALDVDPAKVRDAISGGFASSKVLEVHGKRFIDDNYEPGFKARLHRKDIDIALSVAADAGLDLEAIAPFRRRLEEMIDAGMGEKDSAIAAKAIKTK